MKIRLISLPFALLGACAVSPPDNTFAYKAGNGTVESVRSARVEVPAGSLPGSAAAGGRVETPLGRLARPRWTDGYQLALRMDDGTTQAITQDSNAFHPGERVQVTPEGRVLKIVASSAPVALRAGAGTVQSVDANSQADILMDDGTMQSVIVPGVRQGERVTIGADGRLTW